MTANISEQPGLDPMLLNLASRVPHDYHLRPKDRLVKLEMWVPESVADRFAGELHDKVEYEIRRDVLLRKASAERAKSLGKQDLAS